MSIEWSAFGTFYEPYAIFILEGYFGFDINRKFSSKY